MIKYLEKKLGIAGDAEKRRKFEKNLFADLGLEDGDLSRESDSDAPEEIGGGRSAELDEETEPSKTEDDGKASGLSSFLDEILSGGSRRARRPKPTRPGRPGS